MIENFEDFSGQAPSQKRGRPKKSSSEAVTQKPVGRPRIRPAPYKSKPTDFVCFF